MTSQCLVIGDVQKEYEKLKELKKEDVKKLQTWLNLQPHLPKLTEMQVIHFIHSNYYNTEAAKKCIDNFFTARANCPQFFANRDPQKVELDVLLYTALPITTKEGYKVFYSGLVDTHPDRYNFSNQIKAFDMTFMLLLNKEGTSPGMIMIHDLKGLTFTHLRKLNLLLVQKFFFYLQECMPIRIKGIHLINPGSVMKKILSIFKLFMKKELINVLYVHNEIKSIYKYVPREYFPSNFEGGMAESIQDLHKAYKRNILENKAFFKEEEKQKLDESKRPRKPKHTGERNFKKLEID